MEVQERKVIYYETPDGKQPVQEWLYALRDIMARAKLRARIDRVKLGNFGKCDPVGQGVMELKLDFGPGYRIYFGQMGQALIVLLCGGDKGTQPKDIKRAQEYWADYKRRHSHE